MLALKNRDLHFLESFGPLFEKKSFFDNFAIFLSKNGQNLPKNENLENLEHAFVENNFSMGLYAGGLIRGSKLLFL